MVNRPSARQPNDSTTRASIAHPVGSHQLLTWDAAPAILTNTAPGSDERPAGRPLDVQTHTAPSSSGLPQIASPSPPRPPAAPPGTHVPGALNPNDDHEMLNRPDADPDVELTMQVALPPPAIPGCRRDESIGGAGRSLILAGVVRADVRAGGVAVGLGDQVRCAPVTPRGRDDALSGRGRAPVVVGTGPAGGVSPRGRGSGRAGARRRSHDASSGIQR